MKKALFEPDEAISTSSYPPPYDEPCRGRKRWSVTKQFGFTQFGASRVELPPGAWSTQRHWHKTNDEFVIVVSGELVLVTDDGEEVLGPGDCVGFRMNDSNAHHLQNRSSAVAIFYDVGGRDMYDVSTFPDAGFTVKPTISMNFRKIER